MPLYAYRCDNCGTDFDARRAIDDRDDSECPECGARSRRMLATISVTGSGESEAFAGGCGPEMCAMRQEAGMPCSMAS